MTILGKQVILGARARTVIGIMPPRFQVLGADVWMPAAWNTNRVFEENEPRFFWATGILKRGVQPKTATADLNVAAAGLARIYPRDYPKQFTMAITSLSEAIVADFKGTLLLLAAAVALLLWLSCSNAASLLLVRASARIKEMGVRAALGASGGRLLRQSLVETLVLALAGCATGCGIAFLGLKFVREQLLTPFTQIPWEASISLNWPTLLFAVAVSLCSTLLAGVAPAVYASRGTVQTKLGGSGVGVNPSFRGAGFRSVLVICQVGLSMILLVSSGLTIRSFFALTHADLGVHTANVFEGVVHFKRGTYQTTEQKRRFLEQLLNKIALLPGVSNVSAAITRPTEGGPVSDVTIPGRPHTEKWDTMFEACSEGYFATLNLHLLHGRLLSSDDVAFGRLVAVISQSMANRYFGHEDPLGREIKFNILDEMPQLPHNAYFEVIGVVSDFRNQGLSRPTMPEAFVPYSFTGFGDRGILVRTAIKPSAIQESVRRILWDMDPEVVLTDATTLENYMNQHVYTKPRFSLISLAVCAVVGLVLSVIGIFSVMAYSVTLMTREIGVRMALGAQRPAVLIMVLKKGVKLIGTGMLFGFVAIVLIAPLLKSQLWGISSLDALTIATSAIALLTAGLLACFSPALRATRVDTNTALRFE